MTEPVTWITLCMVALNIVATLFKRSRCTKDGCTNYIQSDTQDEMNISHKRDDIIREV